MAQGILKFELPEEDDLFNLTIHSKHLYLLIHDIDYKLRNEVKYKDNKQAEEVREMIHDALREHHLTLDMLQ